MMVTASHNELTKRVPIWILKSPSKSTFLSLIPEIKIKKKGGDTNITKKNGAKKYYTKFKKICSLEIMFAPGAY